MYVLCLVVYNLYMIRTHRVRKRALKAMFLNALEKELV